MTRRVSRPRGEKDERIPKILARVGDHIDDGVPETKSPTSTGNVPFLPCRQPYPFDKSCRAALPSPFFPFSRLRALSYEIESNLFLVTSLRRRTINHNGRFTCAKEWFSAFLPAIIYYSSFTFHEFGEDSIMRDCIALVPTKGFALGISKMARKRPFKTL